ncbi:unnamed protein product [Rhizoctonia solani]|uniref:BTB domain-containing protein n=1 Tax=Rhizoctonia solani TaxID=456999 RepID=A0A8H3GVC4_9AGAM|nr:unnamed protein product [Rhizoctonia solani]
MAHLHVDDDLGSSNNQGAPDPGGYPIITVDGQTLPVDSDFAYPDGNIELQTSSRRFWVHEFQLAKFAKVTELIRQARDRGEVTPDPERRIVIRIQPVGKVRCIDFQNTFRVIYSSFLSTQAPSILDTETLVSTLRIATLFQNPGLRDFALSELESKRFYTAAIDRIALSDELKLPGWEIAALYELCRRPESISPEEASVLGNARFAKIARIREAELRRQYMALVDEMAMDPFLKADGTVMKDRLGATAGRYPFTFYFGGAYMRLPAANACTSTTTTTTTAININMDHWITNATSTRSPTATTIGPAILATFRLGALKIAATARMHGLPGGDKGYSIEDELKGTS